jgi:Leucine-rich repeat (LRR) protein
MLLIDRLLNIAIAFKPPPSTSQMLNEDLVKKSNKLLVIMVAIVKIKKLEIKVRKKLLRKRRKIKFYEMNKILNSIKGSQSTADFLESNKMPELASNSRKPVTNHGPRKSFFDIDIHNKNNIGGKSAQTPREFKNIHLSSRKSFSRNQIPAVSNSLSNMAVLKCNYYLKQDVIYGDKKLKMSGRNVLPEQLPKDLKNINRLVKLAHSMSIKPSDNETPVEGRRYSTIFQSQISSNLKNLQELLVLDLSTERQSCLNFPLIQIPIELFKLSQLKRLHFDCNKIKTIPDEFGTSMVNLETLTISNNRLKGLPMTFKNMKKLQSLHLSHNKFDSFPVVLCEMPRLRFLDLSTNNIDDIPEQIGNLSDLESLLLFHNNLKSLPKSIGNLKSLKTLWLGENKITKLPREITKIPFIDWNEDSFYLSSNLGGNPLVEPPMFICLKGIQEIRVYFQENDTKKVSFSPMSDYKRSRLSNASELSIIND